MKNLQKTFLSPYLELFTFLDRFCPMCGAPVSVKVVEEVKFEVCTEGKCPYYRPVRLKDGVELPTAPLC
jgi:hypothetical protein